MAKIQLTEKAQVKRSRPKRSPVVTLEEFLSLQRPKGDLLVQIGKEQVSVTSLDRIYWPDEKLTKYDLLCYYLSVADYLMPFLKDRPAILQRWPRGIKAPMFFQQDLETAPSFIKTVRLTNQEGRQLDYAVYSTIGSLIHFVNLGSIEQHPWHSTIKHLDKPDYIAIDLDPKSAPWENVLQVALVVKQVADDIGLVAFPKTSGSTGIHIYVPLKPSNTYDKVAEFARLFAGEVAGRAPKIATIERTIAKRKSTQVYVDWMQNARGKSLAAVYAARAKPKAPVSMPLNWKQIENGIKITDFTIQNAAAMLQKKGNAWANFFAERQSLKFD
ncbi:MAG TPA: non-homologous end-joining DNA ligase [Pyrinomonadaceae bacterium]|nr:non-homologous end-joining DNA ligase [Pyrinomonadaceae bacterium]